MIDDLPHYDFIILGGGAAGLSLAHRFSQNDHFAGKRIGIIEPSSKDSNDRTWCFWSAETPYYEDVVFKKWQDLDFISGAIHREIEMGAYTYHMIRAKDFYAYNRAAIEASHIEWISDRVVDVQEDKDAVIIATESSRLSANIVFKSYLDSDVDYTGYSYVDQHFMGFFIETEEDCFDASRATFMDFSIDQKDDVRFMYVLPYSSKEALVEVAIFSNNILSDEAYKGIIRSYIKDNLKIQNYRIMEEEFGVIPMTTYPFYEHNTARIFGIGTGGGLVKPSSGYAFQRIQEHSDLMVQALMKGQDPSLTYTMLKGRHSFLDKIFLQAVLHETKGKRVFSDLFQNCKGDRILKFLDQKTTLSQELQIISAPPFMPFLRALWKQVF